MEKVFEIVSKISTPLILAGVVILSLFLVYREIIKRNIFPKLAKGHSFEIIKLIMGYLFVLGLTAVILGFAGYAIEVSTNANRMAIYRVRAMIIDPRNQPVDDAEITSAPDGNAKKFKGGWQIDIPAANVSMDRKLTVWATKDNGVLKGSTDYVLGDDYTPTVTVKLERDRSARISGQINDEAGQPLSGAVIYLDGYQNEKVITSETGLFDLPAHAAPYEQIHLFVQKSGYEAWNDMLPAGGSSLAKITLSKR